MNSILRCKNNELYIILFIFLFFISLVILYNKNNIKEQFITKNINKIYRPFYRNLKNNYEGFYNRVKQRLSKYTFL